MTTLGDAMVRIKLDPQGAKSEIEGLNRTLREVESKRRELGRTATTQRRDDAKAQTLKREATENKRSAFASMELADVARAGSVLPVLGVAARPLAAAIQVQSRFGAAGSGMLSALGDELGGALGRAVREIAENLKHAEDVVNDMGARFSALEPAFQQTKQIAKAGLLTGGTEDLDKAATQSYEIEAAQARLQKSIRDETLRALSGNGIKQLIQGLRRAKR